MFLQVQTKILAEAEATSKEREKQKEYLQQQRREKELSVQSILSRASTPAISGGSLLEKVRTVKIDRKLTI
jgi:hypothetical protein